MRNGLLKCAIINNQPHKSVVSIGFHAKNREKEAAASRILIR